MLVWTFGLIAGLILLIFRITGRIKIDGFVIEKFKPSGSGTLVIANHPSLWEAALLPLLFFPWYLWNIQYIPYSTPDGNNFFKKWWFAPFRMVSIPVMRGNRRQEIEALQNIIQTLKEDKIVILFAEGGRTYRGKEFKTSRFKHKVIRRFKQGCGVIVARTRPKIVLIWNQGGDEILPNEDINASEIHFVFPRLWKRILIKVGEPLYISPELPSKTITEILEDKLLELADTSS